MEEENAVKRLALVLAVQAEIEGMKIHNRLCEGKTFKKKNQYTKHHFDAKAEELRNLSYVHTEQLFG